MPFLPYRRALWLACPLVLVLSAAESGGKFTPAQKRLWSLQPIAPQTAPTVAGAKTRVDAFVLAKLGEKGIRPNASADRVTLIRRATLDLTGLPPTLEEVQAFVSDPAPDAFAKVVDRLLASPRYGERWARHWLDLARYADSEGFKSDETRPNVWRYRDYVIDAFNSDKPYHRFVQEQIAGDEMFPGDPQALVATGFNRHFPDESNARNLYQRRQELLNDITDTVGSTFLGLTVGCAKCHDHKFDPILHKDYYRLQAFFAGLHIEDKAALVDDRKRRDYEAKQSVWEGKTKELRAEMQALLAPVNKATGKDNFDKFPEGIQEAITMAPEKRNAMQWQMYYKARPYVEFPDEVLVPKLKGEAKTKYASLAAQLAEFDAIKPAPLPMAQVMVEDAAAVPKTHVLNGGVYDGELTEVQPGFLSILEPNDPAIPAAKAAGKTGRRTVLANWLTDAKNPLVARVMVNRVWHYHFGRGIAGTPSDFGMMGERPTHRELLDDLAHRFMQDGWSVKKLHREIMLSAVYQQSSEFAEAAAKADPENKYLWRFARRRLEGETVRDSMLRVSGLLNEKMYGPGVFPPMPAGVVTRGGWKKNEEESEAQRRSVYVFVRRNTRYPMFESFDMPDTHESCSRRNATVTPGQALELMNSELIFDWSRSLAGRVLNDAGMKQESFVDRAYRLAYQRAATAAEKRSASEFLARHVPLVEARLAKREAVPMPKNMPAGMAPAEAAAVVDLCHAILNSSEFLYLN